MILIVGYRSTINKIITSIRTWDTIIGRNRPDMLGGRGKRNKPFTSEGGPLSLGKCPQLVKSRHMLRVPLLRWNVVVWDQILLHFTRVIFLTQKTKHKKEKLAKLFCCRILSGGGYFGTFYSNSPPPPFLWFFLQKKKQICNFSIFGPKNNAPRK